MKSKNVFPASDVDSDKRSGWICDLSPENVVNPDCYFRFKSRKTAEKFSRLVAEGMSPEQALHEVERKASGTAPDTSLYLGKERRAWLVEQGGIQPVIQRLIDEAIQKS